MDAMAIVSIFVLAVFVGFEVVSKVSSTLHTPLMSGANAIHGVILVGAIIVAETGRTEDSPHPDPLAERIHGAARLTIWREDANSGTG